MKLPCSNCGSIDTEETRRHLWDLYYRLDDGGRKYIEPLVYTQDDLMDDPDWYEDRENSGTWLAMEKNMADRGLCPKCGLPDLRGYTEEDFMSEEDAKDEADYYAEIAAERRAGC